MKELERPNTTRLYVKKSDAEGMEEPVILIGDKKDKKDYQVWVTKQSARLHAWVR